MQFPFELLIKITDQMLSIRFIACFHLVLAMYFINAQRYFSGVIW